MYSSDMREAGAENVRDSSELLIFPSPTPPTFLHTNREHAVGSPKRGGDLRLWRDAGGAKRCSGASWKHRPIIAGRRTEYEGAAHSG